MAGCSNLCLSSSDGNDWSIQALEAQTIPAALGKFYQLSKNLSQFPEAEWMELVVEIEDEKHRIGFRSSLKFTAANSGELIVYANDTPEFYGNNQGWIFATVIRTN